MTNTYLDAVKAAFPNLQPIACNRWSGLSNIYNCIAWAAEDTEKWWWPAGGTPVAGFTGAPMKPNYWPPGVPREETVEAFVQAFEALGYAVCAEQSHESGFTKVAVYARTTLPKRPTHMARQLPDGMWTSKLGSGPDIFHKTLECLEGSQ